MRTLIYSPFSLYLAASLAACSPSKAPPTQTFLCTQTVLDYAELRDDSSKAAEYGRLFTEDGRFQLGPNIVEGRQALMARHRAANETTIFSHVMEDIEIIGLTGKSRVVVYTKNRADSDKVTRVIIADYADSYEMVDDKCLISDRKVSVVYDTNAARIIPAGD